tara:strand:+ start:206 stop:427 length:222 start_codon:yes stop_codon:yes gene_type:complete
VLHVVVPPVPVGTSTKQRLQSARTEFVVLPQVVEAVYIVWVDETAPYCLFAGMSEPHIDKAEAASMKHSVQNM